MLRRVGLLWDRWWMVEVEVMGFAAEVWEHGANCMGR